MFDHLQRRYSDILACPLEVGPGWIALVSELLNDMITVLEGQGHARSDLRISQLKAKFATLRCYYVAPVDLEAVVDRYEAKSALTCESCGALGRVQGTGYVRCICEYCAREENFPLTELSIDKAKQGLSVRFERIDGRKVKVIIADPNREEPSFVTAHENDIGIAAAVLLHNMLEERDEDAESDARLEEELRGAHERSKEPMATPESIARGEAFMKEAQLASIAALRRRVEHGEFISAEDFQTRLQISPDQIITAVSERRLFFIQDETGRDYYPAFYADSRYERKQIERVAQQLANLPPTVKYHFFVSRAFSLKGITPLEALQDGRLTEVLRAATEYAER
jgi:hypothetical protein